MGMRKERSMRIWEARTDGWVFASVEQSISKMANYQPLHEEEEEDKGGRPGTMVLEKQQQQHY
jgi:hypothetical protein